MPATFLLCSHWSPEGHSCAVTLTIDTASRTAALIFNCSNPELLSRLTMPGELLDENRFVVSDAFVIYCFLVRRMFATEARAVLRLVSIDDLLERVMITEFGDAHLTLSRDGV